MRKSATSLVVLLVSISGVPALAGTTTSNVTVTASVAVNCTISTSANVAFGAYDPLVTHGPGGSDLRANGGLSIACVKSTPARITLNQGGQPAAGSSCLVPAPQMVSGSERLSYGLYQDVGLATAWGCDNPGSDMTYISSSKTPVTKTIYGKIPKNQNVGTGNYSDTVTATVNF